MEVTAAASWPESRFHLVSSPRGSSHDPSYMYVETSQTSASPSAASPLLRHNSKSSGWARRPCTLPWPIAHQDGSYSSCPGHASLLAVPQAHPAPFCLKVFAMLFPLPGMLFPRYPRLPVSLLESTVALPGVSMT